MTLRQALFYNLLSAATCYAGFIIGVLVGELSEASVYIFAFAGGMFLYISLGNMVSFYSLFLRPFYFETVVEQ